MLKKRILASSLASVMALSSVSVVAFADETASTNYSEAVTKAELKEIVEGLKDFRDNDLDNYGLTQAYQFDDAYEQAKAVIDDKNATDEDATAAYQMLMAVKESMKTYTKEQLAELVEDCKADYETENKRDKNNADVGAFWDGDAWDDFKVAYEDAEICVQYDSGRDTTELYVELKDTHEKLLKKLLPTVTKDAFRAAKKQYEALLASRYKWEDWRRGAFTVNATTGGAKDNGTKAALDLTKANKTVTFADLKNIIFDTSDVVLHQKGNPAVDVVLSGTWVKIAVGGSVEASTNAASTLFDSFQKTNVTSNTQIRGAYDAMLDAVKVFNGWKADNTNFARKSTAEKLLDDNYQALVNKYCLKASDAGYFIADITNSSGALYNSAKLASTGTTGGAFKVTAEGVTNKANILALKINPNTGRFNVDADGKYTTTAATGVTLKELGDYVKADDIVAGYDLAKFIPITEEALNFTSSTPGADAIKENNVKAALQMIETYVAEASKTAGWNWATAWDAVKTSATNATSGFGAIDPNLTVTKPEGGSKEWTLIHRWAKYAFDDAIEKKPDAKSYKRNDIRVLVEKCYKLANDVGDFSKFNPEYTELVNARQGAIEWLREADATARINGKAYTDNEATAIVKATTTYDIGSSTRTSDLSASTLGSTGASATKVYEALEAVYKNLADQYKYFPVSYGDIAAKIAEVSEGVDAGVYDDKVAEAVADVAFKLSVLKPSTNGSPAFSDKYVLEKFNRLYVKNEEGAADNANDDEKALSAAYTALLKTLEEAGTAEIVKGDADGDGKVTVNDALRTLKASIGAVTLSESEKKAADVDGAPGVTALDALAILRMAI